MKFLGLLLTSFAAIAVANDGVFDDEDGSGLFGVQFSTKFPGDVAVACSQDDLLVISNIIHAVAEIDGIASKLTPKVPQFGVGFEKYSGTAVIDYTGTMKKDPPMKEVMDNMEVGDMLEDKKFGAEMEDDNTDTRRLRLLELMYEEEKAKVESGRLRGTKMEDTDQNDRELDLDDGEWQPIYGFGVFEGVSPDEHGHRELQSFTCPVFSGGCRYGYTVCVTLCGLKFYRRLQMTRDSMLSASPSGSPSSGPTESPAPSGLPSLMPSEVPSGAPSSPPSKSGAPSEAPHDAPSAAPSLAPSDAPSTAPNPAPSDAPSESPSNSPSDSPTIDQQAIYEARVAAMEARVTDELRKKMRFLARHKICPCLGNYWDLEVEYKALLPPKKA